MDTAIVVAVALEAFVETGFVRFQKRGLSERGDASQAGETAVQYAGGLEQLAERGHADWVIHLSVIPVLHVVAQVHQFRTLP